MRSQWNDGEAAGYHGLLAERVYTSRLLGRDHSLVLHGGGNTSVKIRELNVFGEEEDILYIKGSGWDLETIEAAGFAPVRLERVRRLATLERLSDTRMVQELRAAMTDPAAPTPSVETILHAILPYRFVDHTHADALLAITNTTDGERRVREIYGDSVVVIPYVMPGFDLARVVAERFADESGPGTVGMVLLKHGFFSLGETARVAYERMIDLVSRAEAYLDEHHAWTLAIPAAPDARSTPRAELISLRSQVSQAAGFPMVLSWHTDPRSMAFVRRPDLDNISQQGPATPDHVIRTKRVAQLGRDVAQFREAYERYFVQHASGKNLKMLDPAPRIVLDPELGVIAIGRTAPDAAIAFDVYAHTIDIVLRAVALGGYRALPASDIFAVEYWDLEQAKLKKGGKPAPFAGEVALITSAASGIGKAAVDSFLARGAAVVGMDLNAGVEALHDRPEFLGVRGNVASETDVRLAVERAVLAFGGIDMLVLNAGIFPASRKIADLASDEWRKVMSINLDANLSLLRSCHPYLKLAPRGGRA